MQLELRDNLSKRLSEGQEKANTSDEILIQRAVLGLILLEPKDFKAIMLSSTFTDLKEHRQRAIEAISRQGYLPRVMEHSGAQAETDVIDTSLAMVRDAVAYVGVIGLKYGQTPFDETRNPNRLSITELEFNEAMQLCRPIVLFIMGDDHPVRKADIESDPEKQKKLDAFRERAKHMREGSEVQRIYELFDSVEQFSTAAAAALGNLVRYLERMAPAGEKLRGTISNIPINIPFHFLGRADDLATIERALKGDAGRAAIATLHGLRGVGKTTLAAAYADQHRDDYRATWWIRAETEPTMRADLVGLGVQFKWVATNMAEEPAVAHVLERLRVEGDGILLIYDNANNSRDFAKYAPRGGTAHIIVTSNAPNWGAIAAPIEIEVWPKEVGADFLVARTGRATERPAVLALSDALGGLPLAHEQAAAYCERVGLGLHEYEKRLQAAHALFMDSAQDASREYHDGLTVAKTFSLAIDQAAKLHPAAEPLITYAALLAPEPIPLDLFSEGREKLSQPFASSIEANGLDEAVAALRAFALVDRESIPDEREASKTTDCIRLHRLVRQVAAARRDADTQNRLRAQLIEAMAVAYPDGVYNDPEAWLKARRLDAISLALLDSCDLKSAELSRAKLLTEIAAYRQGALAAYADARQYLERALAIREKVLGPEHPDTATSLNNLGESLAAQGDLPGARLYRKRALAIREKVLGAEHPGTAVSLNNLGLQLREEGDLAGARAYFERALAIDEKALGAGHPSTTIDLNNLGYLLQQLGDPAGARAYLARALATREEVLGPGHPDTAASLNNLGELLREQNDLPEARRHHDRALAIREKMLGAEHPDTASSLNNLGLILNAEGDLMGARSYCERALAILKEKLGPSHPTTRTVAENLAMLLDKLDLPAEAAALRQNLASWK